MGRKILSSRARSELFGVPTDSESLSRHYLLNEDDLDLIRTRRGTENQLGLAVHIALLRHPGLGWHEDFMPPAELIAWVAEQAHVDACSLDEYSARRNTSYEHYTVAIRHCGLSSFGSEYLQQTEDIATRAAFATDHGVKIVEMIIADLRSRRLVLPSVHTIEHHRRGHRYVRAAHRAAVLSVTQSARRGLALGQGAGGHADATFRGNH